MKPPKSTAKHRNDENAIASTRPSANHPPNGYFPYFYNADGLPIWLNGSFAGKSAFLLASGPSVSSLDLQLLHGLWTITLNNAHVTYRGNASCVVDDPSRFGLSLWIDPTVLKFVPMSHFNRPLWDNRLLRDGNALKQRWEASALRVTDCPNVVGFRRNERFVAQQWLHEDTINWGNDAKWGGGRSVLLAAIRILYILGFRRVYLLGVDFSMTPEKKYHFQEERSKRAIKGNMETYAKLQRNFDVLQPLFLKSGFVVKNCNGASKLTSFPYIPFAEAIGEAASEIGDYSQERTLGMYKKFGDKLSKSENSTPSDVEQLLVNPNESETTHDAAPPLRIALIYFNISDNPKWKRLFEEWFSCYRASQSSLEVVVCTDPETMIAPDVACIRVRDHEEFCKTPLNKSAWLKAVAIRKLAPCVIFDVDALVARNIDSFIKLSHRFAMADDPGGRTYPEWPEAGPEMNAGIIFASDKSPFNLFIRAWRAHYDQFGHIAYFDQLVWTAVWRQMNGERLPREYNWSHWWGSNAEAYVYHNHGARKWSSTPKPTSERLSSNETNGERVDAPTYVNGDAEAIALVADAVIKSPLAGFLRVACERSGILIKFHSVNQSCAPYVDLFKAHRSVITWNCRMPHRWMTQWGNNVLFIENSLLNQRSGIFVDARGFFSYSNLRHDKSWQKAPVDGDIDGFIKRNFKWRPFSGTNPNGPILCCLQNGPDANLQQEFPASGTARDKVKATLEILREHLPHDRRVIIRPHPRFLAEWESKEAEYRAECWRSEWELSTYGSVNDILPHCSALVAVNSTVVCEALTLGMPVATLGTGVFSDSNVTMECGKTPEKLRELSSFRPEVELCRKFVSAILTHHHLPYTISDGRCNRELDLWLQRARARIGEISTNIMPIYAIATPSVDELCDEVFLASVRRCEPNARVSVARIPIEGSGDFGSKAFKAAQKMRLELITRWIEDNVGGVILVSDIDIEYLRPFKSDMIEALGPAHLAFQRETHDGGVNLGQMVIRCSHVAHEFFSAVLTEYIATGEWEQGIANRLLRKRRMDYRLLDSSFANTKTGFQPFMHSFHAIQTAARNGCSSIQLKMQQFRDLADYLKDNSQSEHRAEN